jgi:hypothetical protein
MSIAASAVAQASLGADLVPTTSTSKPPSNRQITAKADVAQRPEPR